jgi:hypothetical protein
VAVLKTMRYVVIALHLCKGVQGLICYSPLSSKPRTSRSRITFAARTRALLEVTFLSRTRRPASVKQLTWDKTSRTRDPLAMRLRLR